jgi:hypothetical protein
VEDVTQTKLMWKKVGKKNFNATIFSIDNDGPEPPECEMFQLFGETDNLQDVHVKLNTGLL